MRIIIPVLLFSFHFFSAQKLSYPVTEKDGTVDTYFGNSVNDPYRWLEDDRSPKTEDWVRRQNEVTGNYLKNIPLREKLKNRLSELWNYSKESAPYRKGEHYFYYRNNGLQNQSVLYIKKDLKSEGTILLDPNTLSKDGTVSLSGTSVSGNGKILAYGISKAGSDWVEIHFLDIATKTDLPDVIKWVKFSGMSWKGNGIYYSRYAEPGGSGLTQKNQYHKVYYHALGTSQDSDELVMEDKNNPDYNFGASVTEDEKFLFIGISESTSGEKLLMKDLSVPGSQFITIANTFEFDYGIIDNIGSTIYMVTNHSAPLFRLVSFTPETADPGKWKDVLPQAGSLLEGARLCNGNKIIANYLEDVSSKLYCYNLDGKLEKKIELPGICRI
jgi:prolyl oligopeptidase